eukprot:6172133-Pleurochrysis_carterae.AAC.1
MGAGIDEVRAAEWSGMKDEDKGATESEEESSTSANKEDDDAGLSVGQPLHRQGLQVRTGESTAAKDQEADDKQRVDEKKRVDGCLEAGKVTSEWEIEGANASALAGVAGAGEGNGAAGTKCERSGEGADELPLATEAGEPAGA